MKRMPVESSAVERLGYDSKRQILEIEFRGGHVYQYFDVPPSIHDALLKAESKGTFVNERIKGAYSFVQL